MKFELRINADAIYDSLNQAVGDGAEDLILNILGTVNKDGKVIVSKMYLSSECYSEYTLGIS
jgi:hypothetical protein